MKKMLQIHAMLMFCFMILSVQGHAFQRTGGSVEIFITDEEGNPLPGVNVRIKETATGGITDAQGALILDVPQNTILIISYIGYQTQEINVGTQAQMTIRMTTDAQELSGVLVVGSRNAPRSATDTPLPIDVLSSEELVSTGQPTFDKALQYRVPSFNTVQTPVNDATSLLDPYEIRNMGPSRTLILINGKRKNLSSLLYTQPSPGRGETGADISAIPTGAIKRVEILRDGASAQYGSDAIAGVMNIILKDDVDDGSVTVRAGITSKGDGEMMGISLNNGSSLGEGKGFINYTVDLSKVGLANRPGTVDAEGEVKDFGAPLADVQKFLKLKPDAGNINGSSETTAAKFSINGGFDFNEVTSIYANAAYVYKKANSFANYRVPYWRTEKDFPYLKKFFPNGPNGEYVGYHPTFDGVLNDYNATVGFKSKKNDWIYDGSFTIGGNQQTYRIFNTHNRFEVFSPPVYLGDVNGDGKVDAAELKRGAQLYRENSQISFDGGGTRFSHIVGNVDISKVINSRLGIAFGSEFRSETFEIIAGEKSSYDKGGADSYAGNRPEDSGVFNRYNFGGYADISFDASDNFLINGTVRLENYSDFGNAFVWKMSSRYKLMEDKVILRASYSTGFRAPTLHQIYTQKAQYNFVAGEGIKLSGFINNVSAQARLLSIPQLDAEKSTNMTIGIGSRLNNHFNITADYYNIAVKDRIVLSSSITATSDGDSNLDRLMEENNLSSISFFTNAINTRTSGIDLVVRYKNIKVGKGTFGINLSGNYTIENKLDDPVKNIRLVADAGQSVIDKEQEALLFTSRPKTKWILGMDYRTGKFNFIVSNTLFGKTSFQQGGMSLDVRTEFKPKVVTDFSISYAASERVNLTFNINNVLDVVPEWKFVANNSKGKELLNNATKTKIQSNLITFNQRYSQVTTDGSHFSQFGMLVNFSVNVRF